MTVTQNVRGHTKAIDDPTDESNCAHCGRKTIPLRVNIPAGLSHTGQEHWATKPIDACLAPIVEALNDAGIFTAACCCGHGQYEGSIILQDGRELVIHKQIREGTAS